MTGKIIQQGDLGPMQEDGYTRITDNVVVVPGARYEFPSGYTFQVEGQSLVVCDEQDEVAMILAQNAWSASIMAGTRVSIVMTEEDDD